MFVDDRRVLQLPYVQNWLKEHRPKIGESYGRVHILDTAQGPVYARRRGMDEVSSRYRRTRKPGRKSKFLSFRRMKQYRWIYSRYREIDKENLAQSAAVISIAQPIADNFRWAYHSPYAEVISTAFDPEDLKGILPSQELAPDSFNNVLTGRFALSGKDNRVDFFFDAVGELIQRNTTRREKINIRRIGNR